MVTHSTSLRTSTTSYWMRYRESGVYLHWAPFFHMADFPAIFAAPAFGGRAKSPSEVQPRTGFCELVHQERVTTRCLCADAEPLTHMPPASR